MKKFSKKIMLSILTVALTFIALGTSTFAWFSMNTKVDVTGMTVTTVVKNNLLIAPFDSSDATKEGNTDSAYNNSLRQELKGILEPVSTINGVNFFYTSTSNVKADGDAVADTYTSYSEATDLSNAAAGKTKYDGDFQTNYGNSGPVTASNVVYGYLDYTFYLKATNTDDVARNVYMNRCNLVYQGSVTENKAWRVAMFVQTVSAETKAASAIASTDVITILTPASAQNQVANKAVKTISSVDTLAYGAANAIVTYNQAANVISSLAGHSTGYYKVTIRLWLEGEDKDCKNDTFASLTKDWRLDLEFSIGADTGVSNIGSAQSAVATGDATATGTVTLSNGATGTIANGETADTFLWMNESTGLAATGTNTGYTYTPGAAGKYYCLVTTTKGNVYRTNTVELTE